MPLRKGAWYSFGVLKDMEKFAFFDRGKNVQGEECIGGRMYRGKNQEQYI